MKILLTGATGFIGQELGKELVRHGHEIFAVSRNARKAQQELSYPAHIIEGDLNKGPLDPAKFPGVQAVINLIGENIGEGRWTAERKEKILKSRTKTVDNLLLSLPPSLETFVSASAVGYYGDRGGEDLTETSPAGDGFLADVCRQWEASVEKATEKFPKARVVIFRCGVVLGPYGGALMKMLPPFRMNLGGVLGDGNQWMSWIHLEDLVSLYRNAIENPNMQGAYNAVAPEAVTNRRFTEELVQALGVHQGPSVPKFAMKLLFGEMGGVVFQSQKVRSERLGDFAFQFPDLTSALQDCASPYKDGDEIFVSEQYLDMPRAKVFRFFSQAENLESITPSLLNFQIQFMTSPQIEQGTKIDYKLKIRGMPVRWQSLISEWKPNERFVDDQIKGPYQKWEHTHSFEDLGSGTLMRDVVRYRMPLGPLGKTASPLVRKDIESIFSFRRSAVVAEIEKAN